jgi:hypothetical protein
MLLYVSKYTKVKQARDKGKPLYGSKGEKTYHPPSIIILPSKSQKAPHWQAQIFSNGTVLYRFCFESNEKFYVKKFPDGEWHNFKDNGYTENRGEQKKIDTYFCQLKKATKSKKNKLVFDYIGTNKKKSREVNLDVSISSEEGITDIQDIQNKGRFRPLEKFSLDIHAVHSDMKSEASDPYKLVTKCSQYIEPSLAQLKTIIDITNDILKNKDTWDKYVFQKRYNVPKFELEDTISLLPSSFASSSTSAITTSLALPEEKKLIDDVRKLSLSDKDKEEDTAFIGQLIKNSTYGGQSDLSASPSSGSSSFSSSGIRLKSNSATTLLRTQKNRLKSKISKLSESKSITSSTESDFSSSLSSSTSLTFSSARSNSSYSSLSISSSSTASIESKNNVQPSKNGMYAKKNRALTTDLDQIKPTIITNRTPSPPRTSR